MPHADRAPGARPDEVRRAARRRLLAARVDGLPPLTPDQAEQLADIALGYGVSGEYPSPAGLEGLGVDVPGRKDYRHRRYVHRGTGRVWEVIRDDGGPIVRLLDIRRPSLAREVDRHELDQAVRWKPVIDASVWG